MNSKHLGFILVIILIIVFFLKTGANDSYVENYNSDNRDVTSDDIDSLNGNYYNFDYANRKLTSGYDDINLVQGDVKNPDPDYLNIDTLDIGRFDQSIDKPVRPDGKLHILKEKQKQGCIIPDQDATDNFNREFFDFRDNTYINSSICADPVDRTNMLYINGLLGNSGQFANVKISDIYDHITKNDY